MLLAADEEMYPSIVWRSFVVVRYAVLCVRKYLEHYSRTCCPVDLEEASWRAVERADDSE